MDEILNYENKPEDDYYYILGCDELSSIDQIIAEYKTRVLLCHPDKHPNDIKAGEKFAKLQRAKEVLCTPESRGKYDKWRRSGIHMSYDSWCAKKDSVHTSLHWASKCKKEPMLEESPTTRMQKHDRETTGFKSKTGLNFDATGWVREDNDVLRKFRNYEI